MSAAMVKMGVYGALLVSLRLLPAGPAWWGLLLLAFGAVSAVYGILQASVTSDLKRLLAYSTTENVGLMFLALGTGAAAQVGRGRRAGRLRASRPVCCWSPAMPRSRARCSSRPARCCMAPVSATWTGWAGSAPGCRSPPWRSGSAPSARPRCP